MGKSNVTVVVSLKALRELAEVASDAQTLLAKKEGEGVRGLGGMIRRLDRVLPPILEVL